MTTGRRRTVLAVIGFAVLWAVGTACSKGGPIQGGHCVPSCTGKCGGPNGCGGTCSNQCDEEQDLSCLPPDYTKCGVCQSQCAGKCGGPDGCGNQCANRCNEGYACKGQNFDSCVACTPSCAGKCGGPDGCGNTCPFTCSPGLSCQGPGYTTCAGCTPACTGKCGGPDGCGGSCPSTCPSGKSCQGPGYTSCAAGCTPACAGKCGGPDGCGGSCPSTCTAGQGCQGPAYTSCTSSCTPACAGKCGGPDGCGGTCPKTCVAPQYCASPYTSCTVPKSCSTDADCAPPNSICSYKYKVCDDGCTVYNFCTGDESCNTATGWCKIVLPPATPNDIYFAAFGDTRPASSGASYPAVTGTIFGEISGHNPHHVFVVGDYIEHNTSQFTDFLNLMHKNYKASGPVHFVVGNHEAAYLSAYQSQMAEGLMNGKMYYAIQDTAQNAKYVVIADDAWDATQKAYIQAALAKPTKYTFVFRHHPSVISAGSSSHFQAMPAVDSQYATAQDEILAVITAGNPTLVIEGHSHFFGTTKRKWTDANGHSREIIVGNGGAPLSPDQPGYPPNYYGYTIFQVLPSGNVAIVAYDASSNQPVEWHEATP